MVDGVTTDGGVGSRRRALRCLGGYCIVVMSGDGKLRANELCVNSNSTQGMSGGKLMNSPLISPITSRTTIPS